MVITGVPRARPPFSPTGISSLQGASVSVCVIINNFVEKRPNNNLLHVSVLRTYIMSTRTDYGVSVLLERDILSIHRATKGKL